MRRDVHKRWAVLQSVLFVVLMPAFSVAQKQLPKRFDTKGRREAGYWDEPIKFRGTRIDKRDFNMYRSTRGVDN
jgi:hypothetical protein